MAVPVAADRKIRKMTTRPVIPSISQQSGSQSDHTVVLLQQRLVAAEDDTRQLVEQLAKVGMQMNQGSEADSIKPLSSSQPLMMPSSGLHQDTLHRNYEAAVSRLCKAESTLQSLKLSLLRLQSEKDLNRKDWNSGGKASNAKEHWEKEVQKVKTELEASRKECKEAVELKKKFKDEVNKLKEALEAATSSKEEVSAKVDGLSTGKQKLQRRISELKDELTREAGLRQSLEESHNTLLERIRDMEAVVEVERNKNQKQSDTINALKADLVYIKQAVDAEQHRRLVVEEKATSLLAENERYKETTKVLEDEKKVLMSELGKMKSLYSDLHGQIDQMQRLVLEKEDTHVQLEQENKHLYRAMKTAAEQHANMLADYEQQLEVEKQERAEKIQEEETMDQLREQVKLLGREKAQSMQESSQLEKQVALLRKQLSEHQEEAAHKVAELQDKVNTFQDHLADIEAEKQRLLRDKEALLEEVNQTVDTMTEQKCRLDEEMEQARAELGSERQTRAQLQQENNRLLERIASIEQQQLSQDQITVALSEMQEQKNKLAYENGKLTSRVSQLQTELENLASTHTQVVQLQKHKTTVDSKYNKVQTELTACQMEVQRLQSQLKAVHASGQRKEEDFDLAIKSRDEAVKQAQGLLAHIEAIEQASRQKVTALEVDLVKSKEDRQKIAETIERVMTSHRTLQTTVDNLHVNLGDKDTQISQLTQERSQYQQKIRALENKLENVQSQSKTLQNDLEQVEVLEKALRESKADNQKLAQSLHTVVIANTDQQVSIDTLQNQLDKQRHLLDQVREAREQDSQKHSQEVALYEERLNAMKQQLTKERDQSMKKSSKEVAEMRRQQEDLTSTNGKLSRANTDLRQKVTELEYDKKELRKKTAEQNSQIEQLTRVRHKQEQTIAELKSIDGDLQALERSKQKYVQKNEEQRATIQQFVEQIQALQEEIKTLSEAQVQMTDIMQQQERHLQKQQNNYDKLLHKYKEAKHREHKLESLRQQTESKLQEANDESMQISQNLQDAHRWFKSKFDGLQSELVKARRCHSDLEKEKFESQLMAEHEKRKCDETAATARQMIKASRETISRLADYAEVSQQVTNQKMSEMKRHVEAEKDHSLFTEHKYRHLQEASLRQAEELARELGFLKSQHQLTAYHQ